MPLSAGTRLGSYVIEAPLGAGGMGEVYRARDTKLNRDVAIKVLPQIFAADPDRLARFTREAQTLASLNHSNIAHIHGLEDLPAEAGRHSTALVMELVDGEDLSAIIARGPMPLPDILPIARQIANALEAAHDHGIVHRDLKPANVKVTADGSVTVLDFGLAKAMDPARASGPVAQGFSPANLANSPTLTVRGTQLGMILGTAAYMAPEQARGKPVDKRADIWAFGIVVYEMLTGRRAFEGSETSDVLAAVLRQDIDWRALPAETPPRVYFTTSGKLVIQDIVSLARHEVAVTLPLPPHDLWSIAAAPNGRTESAVSVPMRRRFHRRAPSHVPRRRRRFEARGARWPGGRRSGRMRRGWRFFVPRASCG